MPARADTAQADDRTTRPSWRNVSLHLPITTRPSGLGQATAADPRKQGNTVAEDEQRRKLGEQNEWVWQRQMISPGSLHSWWMLKGAECRDALVLMDWHHRG